MPSIVLRVGGDFDVDAFVAAHDVDAEGIWRAGVPSAIGRVPTTSGFSVCLGDDDDKTVALGLAREALSRWRPVLSSARELGLQACVDIGLFVGPEFSQGFKLSVEDLRIFVELGIELEVSAYPCSTDE